MVASFLGDQPYIQHTADWHTQIAYVWEIAHTYIKGQYDPLGSIYVDQN